MRVFCDRSFASSYSGRMTMPLLTSLAATPTRPANGIAMRATRTPITTATAAITARWDATRPAGRPGGRPEGEDEREDMRTRVRGGRLSPGIPTAQPDSHIGLYELSHTVPAWTGEIRLLFILSQGWPLWGRPTGSTITVGFDLCGSRTGQHAPHARATRRTHCSCVAQSRTRPSRSVRDAPSGPSASPRRWTTRSSGVSGAG